MHTLDRGCYLGRAWFCSSGIYYPGGQVRPLMFMGEGRLGECHVRPHTSGSVGVLLGECGGIGEPVLLMWLLQGSGFVQSLHTVHSHLG